MRRTLPPLILLLALTVVARADEGMWLFNNPPRQLLKEKYGFDVTDKWLDHVRLSSVRFNSGGSGSFVSPDGLVMTNHHVGLDTLQQISTKEHDYVKDGYRAETREQEVKAKHLELNVLQSIEDVTVRVNDAVKPEMKPAEAFAARRGVMAEIEKESFDKTGLRSDVVTLYQGGQYHLYRFKKYTDVRLVFAPEQQIAFFGGDPDNFEYPRYDLDICFFRVYEDDKPAKITNYLKWSAHGAKDDELVFVSGHPGRTDRLNTVAELEYLRDRAMPYLLQRLYRLEVLLEAWSARNDENGRRAKEDLFSVKNSRKARDGGLAGLLDPDIMAKKKEQEQKLRDAVASNSDLKDAKDLWDKIAQVQQVRAKIARRYTVLEQGAGFNSSLFGIARQLLRAGEERAKPNAERIPAYRDSALDSLKAQLFSEEPIYPDYELVKLTSALTWLNEQLGHNDPLVLKIMAGKSPADRATELVKGTKLADVALRKQLFEGGKEAVEKSDDPMIQLARLVDPEARALRKRYETEIEEVSRQAYAQLAKAKFAVEGTNTYPDATFTLRLAFGVVKGYEESGKHIPFETYFSGLYQRAAEHHNQPPFDLPKRWIERKDRLNLKTPLNFVLTADIIGGNSGSPVINRDAELVGIIFDGNIQSLVLDFIYTEKEARAVAVHSAGIIEALRKVYDAEQLANELTGKRP